MANTMSPGPLDAPEFQYLSASEARRALALLGMMRDLPDASRRRVAGAVYDRTVRTAGRNLEDR